MVRTRFAPSPTGFLHVGGIRTALFAWLLARQSGGQFILRFEDTDKKREVAGAGEHLITSLRTLGLNYDEGPDIGGPYGPYTQSERLALYKRWAEQLIAQGRAYADPYSPAEVQAFREAAQANKTPFLYRNHRPENPPAWDGSQPLRFKSDPKKYTRVDDVMGELTTGPEVIDDIILIKSDGYPTYNFAHIVDDTEMKISHVIRGQEFLASIPNYLNIYEALGLTPPSMATVPHILGPDGNKKLSKRDGAKDVLDYIRDGYLPEAMINFIASLGWNDGSEQELFSVDELIQKFKITHVQRSGARFDERRLLWMNGAHIRLKTVQELFDAVEQGGFWPDSAHSFPETYKKQVLAALQDRLKYFGEIPQLSSFFFEDLPIEPSLIQNSKPLRNLTPETIKDLLAQTKNSLEQSDFTQNDLTERLNQLLAQTNQKPAVLFSLIRIATTQAPASPAIAETLAILGKEKTLNRIQQQINAL